MKQARTALVAALMAMAALTSCTMSASGSHPEGASPLAAPEPTTPAFHGGGKDWPKGDGGVPSSGSEAPAADEGDPIPVTSVTGSDACQTLARGPWQDVEHGPDPIGRVHDGVVPSLPDGENSAPDQLEEFPDLDSYRDPSTLEDPGMVHEAWKQAGFQRGIEARWGEGHAYTAITVVQFRDAAAAKDALTAHLTDLCRRTTAASVRPAANGLLLTRDSEAVRSVFVMGDIEVSVFTCSCYWADLERRQQGITDWANGVERKLTGPRPKTGTA